MRDEDLMDARSIPNGGPGPTFWARMTPAEQRAWLADLRRQQARRASWYGWLWHTLVPFLVIVGSAVAMVATMVVVVGNAG